MDEAEYIKTRTHREPLLQEILAGYVPRRIDGLKERLPLEIFASSIEEPSLTKRRGHLVASLNTVEGHLWEGGCGQFHAWLGGDFWNTVRLFDYMVFDDMRTKPYYPQVVREVPRELAQKALEMYSRNPFVNPQHHPDFAENMLVSLRGYEGLAHPKIFRIFFTITREFLDGMYNHLCTYVSG